MSHSKICFLVRLAALFCTGFCLGSLERELRAQTVYQWTDEKGTVHFSDQPPAGRSVRVEERHLPVAPPREAAGAEPASSPPASSVEAKEANETRVVLERQEAERSGASSFRVSGRVRNTGKSSAQAVRVLLSALDPVQGNPCFEQSVAVEPEVLNPGEAADFSLEIESPCFRGETTVQFDVRWEPM
jgi:hypothetical protein